MLLRIVRVLLAGLFLLTLVPAARAADAAQASAELKGYLPPSSFAAEYVVIEPDPNFDAHGKRIQAAMAANKEWLAEYRKQYAGKDMPWHPNFGVSEADYQRYRQPMNQFREASRKPIRVEMLRSGSTVTLKLKGDNLLLTDLEIDMKSPAGKTPRGPLGFRAIVSLDPGQASLPPGAYQGTLFNTPDAVIQNAKYRESVLIGLLKGTRTGIIHYELYTRGKAERVYLTYPLGN